MSDLDDAKRAASARNISEPELVQALSDAKSYSIEILCEENRHKEELLKIESQNKRDLGGWIGRIWGEKNGPIFAAYSALIIGSIGGLACLFAAYHDVSNHDFWSRQAERCLAFAAAALAFIFGRSGGG